MARRNSQHETGDRGIKIVLGTAPDHWVDQEQKKDYGIDIKFELFNSGRHSGVEFGVQVRSTTAPRFVKSGEFILCKLETDNLDDHLSCRRYPVYLFCVDVASEAVYWICLQRYAKQITGWKSKKSIAIRVPTNQTLRDHSGFEQQLRKDWQLVADIKERSDEAPAMNQWQAPFYGWSRNGASLGPAYSTR